MTFYKRAAYAIAEHGFLEALCRGARKLSKEPEIPPVDLDRLKEEYAESVRVFREKTSGIDFQGLDRFLWYHTVDLGNGIVTPGRYDYRSALSKFRFPEDMCGMNVLDIGSATGFFSFEFERRGARVVSVELPSISDWDMPAGEDKEKTLRDLMEFHGVRSVEEVHYLHLEGPFRFCHTLLRSSVKRCYSTVYDLSLEKLGLAAFDMIFLGDLLLHLFSPLEALSTVAPLCRGKLIIFQKIPDVTERQPLMVYLGGETRKGDSRTWWYPNRTCFVQMLRRLGFRTVDFVSEYEVVTRPDGACNTRAVIHAAK